MFSIVFICTGNTCRSPMAQELGRRYLLPLGPDVEVGSAGLAAPLGQPAAEHAQAVVSGLGGDLSGHRSRPLSDELVSASDLIVTMTQRQTDELRRRYPQRGEQILTLAQLADARPPRDIADPIGGPREVYERTCFQIEEYLRAAIPQVKQRLAARDAGGAPNPGGSLKKGP